jgi:hypothetical protein
MAIDAKDRRVLKAVKAQPVPPTPAKLAQILQGKVTPSELSVALQHLVDGGQIIVAADWKLRTTG